MYERSLKRQESGRRPANGHRHRSVNARANQSTQQVMQTRVLFATNRPAALAFMVEYGRQQDPPLKVTGVPLDARTLAERARAIAAASVLVLDIADDPEGAVAFCKTARKQRADLPILALLCCERPTQPWHVRALLDLGVASFLDARVEPAELAAEVAGLAAGQETLHLRLHRRAVRAAELISASNGKHPASLEAEQAALVELVALGLTNAEIGRRLHLATSTVHHHVAELCSRLNLQNRIALAAWAGANGYFDPLRSERLPWRATEEDQEG